MVVVYKMPWFTYQIAKRVVTVPYISLVNILAGKPLVKELIQEKATADALSGQMMALINNPSTMAKNILGWPRSRTSTTELRPAIAPILINGLSQ